MLRLQVKATRPKMQQQAPSFLFLSLLLHVPLLISRAARAICMQAMWFRASLLLVVIGAHLRLNWKCKRKVEEKSKRDLANKKEQQLLAAVAAAKKAQKEANSLEKKKEMEMERTPYVYIGSISMSEKASSHNLS